MQPSDFARFYLALYNRAPFPWQMRLADQVIGNGGWPKLIELPTGSGKTSVIDIAVFALACKAESPHPMPRRILYLVDRRIVVDSTFAHSRHIAGKLKNALQNRELGILHEVAQRLQQQSAHNDSAAPLHVSILRGGMYREDAWVRSPLQPTICVSTIDQIGSRLLFRGYGTSPKSWPVHAGLIANDSLLILDEAHISRPFSQTLSLIEHYCGPDWNDESVSGKFAVVKMSATLDEASGKKFQPFRLTAEDGRNQILSSRLKARKFAVLEEVTGADQKDEETAFVRRLRSLAYELAWPTVSETEAGPSKRSRKPTNGKSDASLLPARVIAIVVNRVATARAVFELFRNDVGSRKSEAILLTGRIRPYDRDLLLHEAKVNGKPEGWLKYIGAAGDRPQLDRPLFVVATQTVEVGADLDFDGLVTEIAPLDSLKQRFGRVDRLGLKQASRSYIVARSSAISRDADDWLYGKTLGATWKLLNQVAKKKTIDFGIDALKADLTKIDAALLRSSLSTTLADEAPVLLPAHVDALCQTSPRPYAEPHIPLLLHGDNVPAEVQIVWRSGLPDFDADNAEETIIKCLEFLSPTTIEALSLPFVIAKRWLESKAAKRRFTDEQSADFEGKAPHEGKPRNSLQQKVGLRWRGIRDSVLINAGQLQPGDTIVVQAEFGGVDRFGWNPALDAQVTDISEVCNWLVRHELVLHIPGSGLPLWPARTDGPQEDERIPELRAILKTADDNDALQDATEEVAALLRSIPTEAWVNGLADLQASELFISRHPVSGWVLTIDREFEVQDSKFESGNYDKFGGDDDEPSLQRSRNPVTLAKHLQAVGDELRGWCSKLHLNSLAETLSLAGDLHDIGKADPRFQAYLHRGNEVAALSSPEPLAKSKTTFLTRRENQWARKRSGLPQGFRHEALSTAMIANSSVTPSVDMDLLQHLVGTHHGYGRPLLPVIEDGAGEEVRYELRSAVLSATPNHDLHKLDHGWPDRFWRIIRRYGWWGAAYLEALVRLADHRVSEREQLKSKPAPEANTQPISLGSTKIASSKQPDISLLGVDGESPLGFLTAVGAFRLLSQTSQNHDVRLSWFWDGNWTPRIHGFTESAELLDSLSDALNVDRLSVAGILKTHLATYANLTIPATEFHALLADLAGQSSRGNRLFADFYASLGSDAYPNQKEQISDTALRTLSGAGHQDFLGCMRALGEAVQREHIEAALFSPWNYLPGWKSFRWDPQEDRRYALRAQNPSSEKTESVPGANRLAFEALPLFPTFAASRNVVTQAFSRGTETVFSWPVWSIPISLSALKTLLGHAQLVSEKPDESELRPLGVEEIFRSTRITVGHYRNFTPSRACWGATLAVAAGQ